MQQLLTFRPQGIQMARPWRTHPRETLAGAMLGAIALIALGNSSGATPLLPESARQETLLPKPLPSQVRDLAPESALQLNAQIPLAGGPNPPAIPFVLGKASAETRARALECLTSAVYYEAAQEPTGGQRAVAQVVLNRVRHAAFPNSVCGVVFEGSTRVTGCQFTFTCDGSLARKPARVFWDRADSVARQALAGAVYAPVGLATHYHTVAIHPYWADSLHKVTTIGAHIFYRWRGAAGQSQAFSAAYRGGEPIAAPHPRSAEPAPAAEADPLVLARVFESSHGPAAPTPPPAYADAVEARGGEALFRGDNLPQGGALSPLLERSGQWLQRP